MRVLAVVGPTAVGKSALAVKLAKKYNGTADYKLKEGVFVAKVMLDTMEERP